MTIPLLPAFLVFLGGGAGSLARYMIAVVVDNARARPGPAEFPIATLIVNVVGCAIIGSLAGWAAGRELWRHGLLLGFLGGFTTFSSFGLDTARLLAAGAPGKAAIYVLATNVAGIGLAILGFYLSGAATRPPFVPE
ncbi:MAG: hypothetical protein CMJ31_06190 [Phycisphaerae bacterium]|nr:hypothetical protein [Phycisphaerae bacterium]